MTDLERSQYELWRHGLHALYDLKSNVLWQFLLSDQSAASHPDHTRRVNHVAYLLQKRGLTSRHITHLYVRALMSLELSSGSTSAADLDKDGERQLPGQTAPLSTKAPLAGGKPSSSFHADSTSSDVTVGPVLDAHSLRNKLQQAAAQYVIYGLTSSGFWLPLGPHTIVSRVAKVVAGEGKGGQPVELETGTDRHCIVLDVQSIWLPAGTLVVFGREVKTSLVINRHASEQSLETAALNNALILAPFAIRPKSTLITMTGQPSIRDRVTLDRRYRIELWFGELGIHIDPTSDWTVFMIGMVGGDHIELPWPSEFCYQESSGRGISFEGIEVIEAGDAVRDAENWAQVFTKQSVNQQAYISSSGKQHRHSRAISTDDALLALFSQPERATDIRSAAGIYPTPPEGVRGHLATQVEGSDVGEWARGTSMDLDHDAQAGDVEQMANVSSQGVAYDRFDDDELFGTVNGGTYADNGITEDDFSFFDEPDAQPQSLPPDLGGTVDREGHSSLQDSTSQLVEPDVSKPDTSPLETSIVSVEADYISPSIQETPVDGSRAEIEVIKEASHISMTLVSQDMPASNDQQMIDSEPYPVPLLDEKYGKSGKYFSRGAKNTPSTMRPSSVLHNSLNIPLVNSRGSLNSPSDSGKPK